MGGGSPGETISSERVSLPGEYEYSGRYDGRVVEVLRGDRDDRRERQYDGHEKRPAVRITITRRSAGGTGSQTGSHVRDTHAVRRPAQQPGHVERPRRKMHIGVIAEPPPAENRYDVRYIER